MADDASSRPAVLAQRLFQSDALDAPISAADLRALSYDQLMRLAAELRQRLDLLDQELVIWASQGEKAINGLHAQVHRSMVELRHFLLFLEERVLRHRLRLRRAGEAPVPVSPARSSGSTEVA